MTGEGAGGPQILFRAPDVVVRLGPACGSDVCFVTFTPFSHDRSLERPGFGEAFLASRGFDAVHVIGGANAWFDYPQIHEALAAVAAAVAGYRRVITYGSSMGGYAAIRFAESVGAQVAVAISPQYGITAPAAPFERRFRAERPRFGRRVLPPRHGSHRVEPIVLFDPLDLDARHAALIRQNYPRTIAVPLPNAGHPAGLYLDEAGLLTGAIVAIAEARFDAADFVRQARARRRHASQYFFTLARRLGPAHLRAKAALLDRAIALRDDGSYRLFRATLLEMDGDIAGAQAQIDRAEVVLPDHPVVRYAHASFAMRQGRWEEAGAKVAALIRDHPANHRFVQLGAVIDAVTGGPLAARLPREMARTAPERLAWRAWLLVVHLLARLHHGRPGLPLPRWHERYFSLPRELQLMDEWAARRRGRVS